MKRSGHDLGARSFIAAFAAIVAVSATADTPPPSPPSHGWPPPPPRLSPYLSSLNLWGGSELQPGAIIPSDPISSAVEALKRELAHHGANFSLYQNFSMGAVSRPISGQEVIAAYSFELLGTLSLFRSDALGGTDAWISAELDGGQGLGVDWTQQSPGDNIGAMTETDYAWWGRDIFIAQLAWSQSFLDGRLVVVAGVVDQTNYFDTNEYANSGFGQLQNAALVESQVFPMTSNTLGFNLQWQPEEWLYLMLGVGSNTLGGGRAFNGDLDPRDLSMLGEIGFVLPDAAGLGRGTYRIQPFAAVVDGDAGGGIAFNLQQQLGRSSPLGAFARLGVGTETTAIVGGAVAQASGGLVLQSPFAPSGPFSAANDEYAAIGFKWTRAPSTPPSLHRDEYALECTYAMQLTPTATLQPDLQFVWNPADSPRDFAVVFQLTMSLRW